MPAIVDKDKKRLDIVNAAADVFAGTGYHEATIQEIATKAEIGKGTVYEYFRTKEDLFLAVYDEWMSDYENTVRQRVDEAEDTLAKVDAVRESAVEFYQRRASQAPLLLEFWAHALRTDNPAFLERINATRTFLRELGARLTSILVTAGWFSPVDAESFAKLEAGISDGIFLTWVLDGQSFPLEKAYTFRQSLIGLGLLSAEARQVLGQRLASKLERGLGNT
jgi:AcrR family transcriptional regulator